MDNIKLIYFSPTNGTKKIVEAIAGGISCKNIETVNITQKSIRDGKALELSNELAIIGVPVYAGRVPTVALSYLRRIKAQNTPAVIIAVYGGRAFDSALFELQRECQRVGMKPFAAGAFIAEHSFASSEIIIENGRPDEADLKSCSEFAEKVEIILKNGIPHGELEVPGSTILKKMEPILPGVIPYTNPEKCVRCMKCVEVCPTNAIDKDNPIFIEKDRCIKCSACVKVCPYNAISLDLEIAKKIAETVRKLGKKYPEFFFMS